MAEHTARTEHEAARQAELADLVASLRPRLPHAVAARATAELDAAAHRLALGAGHRVVALVGGTGSGKSSLFNAISGLDVADVGVVRPTTSLPTACVWGSGAAPLLDHLGVPPERRHRGETALTGPEPGLLDGVVLLDVPDHDSIAVEHREQVDRLVPVVDLLVWVLDPQKYADHRLHSDYLAALVGRQDGMLVVVNQTDTVTTEGLEELRLDVARLLVHEGLGGVEVVTTSARTGAGIPALRQTLRRVSETASIARAGVREQLDGVARDLLAALAPTGSGSAQAAAATDAAPGAAAAARTAATCADGVVVPEAARRLGDAIGVPAVADALAAAVRGGVAVPEVREPVVARMAAIRSEWLEAQAAGLAPAWRSAVEAVLPSAGGLGEAAVAAVRQVPVTVPRRAGVLTRLRPAVVERLAGEARDGYLAATTTALEGCVRSLLAPSHQVRVEVARARAALEAALGGPSA